MCSSSESSPSASQQVESDPQIVFQDETLPDLVPKVEEVLPAPPLRVKSYEWPNKIRVGDCEMAPLARITFRSDGWGFFDAKVKSDDSGDYFRIGFYVMMGDTAIRLPPSAGVYQQKCPDDESYANMHVDFQLSPIYYDKITTVRRWFHDCSG
jgi:hypothetical protein